MWTFSYARVFREVIKLKVVLILIPWLKYKNNTKNIVNYVSFKRPLVRLIRATENACWILYCSCARMVHDSCIEHELCGHFYALMRNIIHDARKISEIENMEYNTPSGTGIKITKPQYLLTRNTKSWIGFDVSQIESFKNQDVKSNPSSSFKSTSRYWIPRKEIKWIH